MEEVPFGQVGAGPSAEEDSLGAAPTDHLVGCSGQEAPLQDRLHLQCGQCLLLQHINKRSLEVQDSQQAGPKAWVWALLWPLEWQWEQVLQ